MTDKEILNLAQAELRAMYKRVGINGSNVLDLVDKALDESTPPPVQQDIDKWVLGILKMLEPYLDDLEKENTHEPSVGIFYNEELGKAYRSFIELISRLESGLLLPLLASKDEEANELRIELDKKGNEVMEDAKIISGLRDQLQGMRKDTDMWSAREKGLEEEIVRLNDLVRNRDECIWELEKRVGELSIGLLKNQHPF